MTLQEIKTALRNGPYAWPGGYPLFFISTEGDALSFEAVRKNWREVCRSHLNMQGGESNWHLISCEANWEDPNLICAETNERIPSAYAEPE
jgi:hypothetical protein